MTKQEAEKALLDGKKVRHDYYSNNEYVRLNAMGLLETEEGYTHGTFHGKFWTVYQKWETGWSMVY